MQRIKSLDGLRGMAIILVILFHIFSRWPEYLPSLTGLKYSFLFKYGYLGVSLFFMISGYVIFMTIENCKTFPEFIFKRWIRLFPAIFIVTLIVFLTSRIIYIRPNGIPNFIDLVSGLIFIEPTIISKLFDIDVKPLEGSFWSLFVEVKFYFIFGIIYFINKKQSLLFLLILFMSFIVFFAIFKLNPYLVTYEDITLYETFFSFRYFGLFSAGICFYKYIKRGDYKYLILYYLLFPFNAFAALGNRFSLEGAIIFFIIY